MKQMIKLLRCKHYIKNLLIFFPLFFSGKFLEIPLLVQGVGGFIIFSCITSVVYIINDIQDIEKDRLHPVKKNRPLVTGEISVTQAIAMAGALLLICVGLWIIMELPVSAVFIAAIYMAMNFVYSFGGKNIPVLDLLILALGFPLRVLFGGYITRIEISSWLFLTVLCVSLYLGLGKRRGELKRIEQSGKTKTLTRPVLEKYNMTYLTGEMYLYLGLGLVFYSMWALEKAQQLVYTVPLVIAIAMRYNLLVATSSDGDPVETILSDMGLLGLAVVYAGVMFFVLYA